MGRQSQNDGGGRAESPGDHLGEDVSSTVTAAAAGVADNPKESTLKQTVVRAPGGKRGKQINLDECYMQFDVMDTDGQLMDLSLCNQRARVSDVLLHNFHYIFCRVYRERDAMKAVDCVNMSTHTVVWNAARQFKNARNAK